MSFLRYLQKKVYGIEARRQSKFFHDQWYICYGWKDFRVEQTYNDLFTLMPPHDRFYADPFPLRFQNRFYIFFEEYEFSTAIGYISVVEVFTDGKHSQVTPIIKMPYHMSYPCLFWYLDTLYMLPETYSNKTIELWECVNFPYKWKKSHTLISDIEAVDTTPFFHEGIWYLFSSTKENVKKFGTRLDIFWSENIFSQKWTPHPLNPVKRNLVYERPAGNIIQHNNKIYRPTQDSIRRYGGSMELREINILTTDKYQEEFCIKIHPDQISLNNLGCHTLNYDGDFMVLDAIRLEKK